MNLPTCEKNKRNKEKLYLKCKSRDKGAKRNLRHDNKLAQNTIDKIINFFKKKV